MIGMVSTDKNLLVKISEFKVIKSDTAVYFKTYSLYVDTVCVCMSADI